MRLSVLPGVFQSRHIGRRWSGWGAENIRQQPFAPKHHRSAVGIRSDRQNACLTEETAANAVVESDFPEMIAIHIRYAVMTSKTFVQVRIVGRQKVYNAA